MTTVISSASRFVAPLLLALLLLPLVGCSDSHELVVFTVASGSGGSAGHPNGAATSVPGSAGGDVAMPYGGIAGVGGLNGGGLAGAGGGPGASGAGGVMSVGGADSSPAPSSGCGKAHESDGQYREQPRLTVASMQRGYYLRVPVGYDAKRAYPLIFRWHGAGGDALDGAIPIEMASKEDALVVSADGHDTPFGNGWDFDAGGPDVKLFDALLERVSADYCVDPTRLFSYGFSMGGGFSLILGCVRGEQLRGVAAVEGGWLPPATLPEACVGHVATWIVQGRRDPVVTAEHAAHIRDTFFLPQNGCSTTAHQVEPSPCTAFDGCLDGYPEVWCETDATHDPQAAFASLGAWAFWGSLPSSTTR